LQIEHADLSLLGNREENQDRVAIAIGDGSAVYVVCDGMGGHAAGDKAAGDPIRAMVGDVRGTAGSRLDAALTAVRRALEGALA